MKRPDTDTLNTLDLMVSELAMYFSKSWCESLTGGNETESIHQWNLGVQKLNELNALVFPQSEVHNEVTSDLIAQSPEALQEQFNKKFEGVDL